MNPFASSLLVPVPCARAWAALVAVALLGTSATAQVTKLNPPFGYFLEGAVTAARFSQDGNWFLYLADQDLPGRFELYRAPSSGGPSIKLNGTLGAGGNVTSFAEESGRVVYRADQQTDEKFELFTVSLMGSVPLLGGPPQKISGSMVPYGDVTTFKVLNASVFFLADAEADGRVELYRKDLTEFGVPQRVKLNGPLVAGGSVTSFEVAGRVVYRADQAVNDQFELFSVPLGGGTAVRLTVLPSGRDVASYALSPNGALVVYRADFAIVGRIELSSVPIAGGSVVRLDNLTAAGQVNSFQISPDSNFVVYERSDSAGESLLRVRLFGGPSQLLTFEAPANRHVSSFRISGNSQTLAYIADFGPVADDFHLYRKAMNNGPQGDLCFSHILSGDALSFDFAPDSSRIIFRGDLARDGRTELFSVAATGGQAVRLNALLFTRDVASFRVQPDSTRVLFRSSYGGGEPYHVFSVPIAGGTATRLSTGLPTGADVGLYGPGPGAGQAFYEARLPGSDGTSSELYGVQSGNKWRLDRGRGVLGDVADFQLSADGSTAVFRADGFEDGLDVLFASHLATQSLRQLNGLAVPLSGELAPETLMTTSAYQVSGTGDWVEYTTVLENGQVVLSNGLITASTNSALRFIQDLALVPRFLSCPDPARFLSIDTYDQLATGVFGAGVVQLGVEASAAALSPSANRIVFQRSEPGLHAGSFHSVPIAGGAATQLTPVLELDVAGESFLVTSDGTRVVYRGDRPEVPGTVYELFSVPMLGGTVVPLTPLVSNGSVTDFALTADGSRVVYRARQLFSVPVDGGPVTRLSPLTVTAEVVSFALAPDGARAVYMEDRTTGFELWSVPTAGGSAVRLSSYGRSVEAFRISPDGSTVAYTAEAFGRQDLFSVPITGGVAFNHSFYFHNTSPNVLEFEFSPDGQWLVYRADLIANDTFDLYASSMSLGQNPRKLSPTPVSGGDIRSFRVTGDSQWVVYLADQETDEVVEIYCTEL